MKWSVKLGIHYAKYFVILPLLPRGCKSHIGFHLYLQKVCHQMHSFSSLLTHLTPPVCVCVCVLFYTQQRLRRAQAGVALHPWHTLPLAKKVISRELWRNPEDERWWRRLLWPSHESGAKTHFKNVLSDNIRAGGEFIFYSLFSSQVDWDVRAIFKNLYLSVFI